MFQHSKWEKQQDRVSTTKFVLRKKPYAQEKTMKDIH